MVVGTAFLRLNINTYVKSDMAKKFDKYGTDPGYSYDILKCKSALIIAQKINSHAKMMVNRVV
jgi:hypothetical protein